MIKLKPLINFRKSKMKSQEEFARLLGVSISYYVKVETGHCKAGMGFIKKFAETFPNESVDFFFEDETEPMHFFKTANWIVKKEYHNTKFGKRLKEHYYKCSECCFCVDFHPLIGMYNFCPNCGTPIDKVIEEGNSYGGN